MIYGLLSMVPQGCEILSDVMRWVQSDQAEAVVVKMENKNTAIITQIDGWISTVYPIQTFFENNSHVKF